MDVINHQSNGAKGLRIAATILVVLGWVALLIGVILGFAYADEIIFIFPMLAGAAGLGLLYLSACLVRGFASLVETAQLYRDNNTPLEDCEE